MDQLTQDDARGQLAAWTAANAMRDLIIRRAHKAGLSKTEIHRITGVARTTIDRITAANNTLSPGNNAKS